MLLFSYMSHKEGTTVNVSIEFLAHSRSILEVLYNDGWWLSPGQTHGYHVGHPAVSDEEAARSRLFRLGLLTSSLVRIDFPPCQSCPDR
jgi:hypothetical protein